MSPLLIAQLDAISGPLGGAIDRDVLLVGVTQWAKVFGMVSFELFGTFHNVFDDADDVFAASVELDLAAFGLL